MTKLGHHYRCRVTGHKGIAIARCEFLTGCTRLNLQGKAKDGKVPSSEWVDEQLCEPLDKKPLVVDNGETPGGSANPPKRGAY